MNATNAISVPTNKQQAPVHKALAILTEQCDIANSEVCRLRESIAPALTPSLGTPYSDLVPVSEDDCVLVKRLNDCINNLYRTNHLLRETTEQVAL